MRKLTSFFGLLLCFIAGMGQNLVVNPGFEIYSAGNDTENINHVIKYGSGNSFSIPNRHLCYDWFGRYCIGWEASQSGFGLRNRCWDSLGYMIGKSLETTTFENEFDTAHLTHSGMSSANLFIKDYPNSSTYISADLKDTLCEGCEYAVSFYVYVTTASNVIFNNIGLKFTCPLDTIDYGEEGQSNYASQFFLKSKVPLKQGVWHKMEYTYTAKGNETGILITKYRSKQKVKPLRKHENKYVMSVYIDDVVVEKVEESISDPQN